MEKPKRKLLSEIELPAGLASLTTSELELLCLELREELIAQVSESGGHFASSLGATEISVALHHTFSAPKDRLVWDVGHQAYIHKMLTGRMERMPSIRKKDGISGFLRRDESIFDTFGAGHAGTSISAAVGMSVATQHDPAAPYVVAVIGDGSLTSGMAFEALNHAGDLGLKRFIVVINDNEMSISPNVGAISRLFSKAITSRASNTVREKFKSLHRQGYVPEIVYKALDRAEDVTQGFLRGPSMLFESFGFRYIGPVDGHNLSDLTDALRSAKSQDIPVVIHAHTVKGKGYEPAEGDPIKWHGVLPFNRHAGEFHAAKTPIKPPPSYTAVFAQTMIDLAKSDARIIAITAAMPGGTGLDTFQAALPQQFFDVGICEQHAVTFAAGLACEGKRPVCAIYSTFLQRAYDQVVHDVCIQKLPVFFALDRGGLVGNDGETHQGVFDISFLRSIPHMVIMSPKDENEFRHMLLTGVTHDGPIAIRYPRGIGCGVVLDTELHPLPIGKAEVVREGSSALLICFGPLVQLALRAADTLMKNDGINCTVINARFAKPLDTELLATKIPNFDVIATVEDHVLQGGFGSAVLELIDQEKLSSPAHFLRFGIDDDFVGHASQAEQYASQGLTVDNLIQTIRAAVLGKNSCALSA